MTNPQANQLTGNYVVREQCEMKDGDIAVMSAVIDPEGALSVKTNIHDKAFELFDGVPVEKWKACLLASLSMAIDNATARREKML